MITCVCCGGEGEVNLPDTDKGQESREYNYNSVDVAREITAERWGRNVYAGGREARDPVTSQRSENKQL